MGAQETRDGDEQEEILLVRRKGRRRMRMQMEEVERLKVFQFLSIVDRPCFSAWRAHFVKDVFVSVRTFRFILQIQSSGANWSS